MDWSLVLGILVALGAWTASVFSFGNWLSRRFNSLGDQITSAKDGLRMQILDHEKLDDTRFEELKMRMLRLQMRIGDFDPIAKKSDC